jgi:hypothetical protein
MTTDSALQPFVTIRFTRLPWYRPVVALTADKITGSISRWEVPMKRAVVSLLAVVLTSAALSAGIGMIAATFPQPAMASDRP